MTADTILAMLQCVRDGELRPEEAMERLANLPYEEAGFAKIDHHRRLRTGLPEVIYAGGKTAAQVGEIFFRMAAMGGDVLATRANEAAFAAVKTLVPEAQYYPVAAWSGSGRHRKKNARATARVRSPSCAREPAICRSPRRRP